MSLTLYGPEEDALHTNSNTTFENARSKWNETIDVVCKSNNAIL